MYIKLSIMLIVSLTLSSCGKKKNLKKASDSSNISQNTADANIPEDVEQSAQEESLNIIDITIDNLMINAESKLEVGTTIGTVKALFSDDSKSDKDVVFQILETAETDYEIFELSDSTITNKADLIGNKRYVLNLFAEFKGSTFKTNILFSISVKETTIENPMDILLSNNTILENNEVGQDIGAIAVEDQEGFTHGLKFVNSEGNDNSLFVIQDSMLKAGTVFDYEEKNEYTVEIEASNNEHPDKKISRIFTIQIEGTVLEFNDLQTAADPLVYNSTDASINFQGRVAIKAEGVKVYKLTFDCSGSDNIQVGSVGLATTIRTCEPGMEHTTRGLIDIDWFSITSNDVEATLSNINLELIE